MRGPHWAIFLILVFSLLACKDLYTPPDEWVDEEGDDGVTYTNVVYSPDGKSVTLYLEGGVEVPNRQKRALSKELAIAGHDYFEVAFYYQAGAAPGSGDVIARTSWELYKDAHITGVRGKGAGESVNYSENHIWNTYIDPNGLIDPNGVVGFNPDGTPIYGPIYGPVEMTVPYLNGTTRQGAAVLFVGRKTDKTLLGIGELTHVNGSLGTTITSATTSVTFTVAALECGLSPDAGLNSFWTNYRGVGIDETNTARTSVTMGSFNFYMYELRDLTADGNSVTSSEYTFRTSANTFDYYRRGIILAGPGAYEKRQPRYPTPDGRFQFFSVMLDDQTIITSGSNTAPNVGKPFINPVEMTFNTTYTVPGSIFALAFQIPVCPLYLDEDAGTWYIRASYDSYWLDLDDAGLGGRPRGAGGAIMFRTGTVADVSAYRIRVVAPPNKYLYSYHTNANNAGVPNSPTDKNPVNRYFNVYGLVVALEYSNGDFIRYLNNNELTFEIGMKAIVPRIFADNSVTPPIVARDGDVLPMTVYGLQVVKVIYFHPSSMINHETSFYIIVDNSNRQYTGIPDTGNPPNPSLPPDANNDTYLPPVASYLPGSGIPMQNFIVVNSTIAAGSDLADYLNTRMNYAGKTVSTFVVIFDSGNSQNFLVDFKGGVDLQSLNNYPNLIINVAGRATGSGIYNALWNNAAHVGRANGTLTYGVYRAWGTANSFYFGRWPFNDYLYGVGPASDYHNLAATSARYDYVDEVNLPTPPNRFVHRTYSYSFDAYGPAANGGEDSPPSAGNPVPGSTGTQNRPFLNDGHGGRFYNVRVPLINEDPANAILFYNRRWLN
jgi:hypothetical protein